METDSYLWLLSQVWARQWRPQDQGVFGSSPSQPPLPVKHAQDQVRPRASAGPCRSLELCQTGLLLQKKIKQVNKIREGVQGVITTFGSKNIKFMSVKQLEDALLRELKCTVLPMAMETPAKNNQKARKVHAAQIWKMINQTVTKIVTTVDPYCLANMASQGIYKDCNTNACLKTSLHHIVHELFNYQRSKEDLKYQENQNAPSKRKKKHAMGVATCFTPTHVIANAVLHIVVWQPRPIALT